jgi:hypothetical protein
MVTSPPPTSDHLHPFTTPTLVPPTVLSSVHSQRVSSCRGTNRGRTSERITTTQPPPVTETTVIQLVVVTIAETTPTLPIVVVATAAGATPVEPAVHPNIPTSVERIETVNGSPTSTNVRDYEILSLEIASVRDEMLVWKSKIILNKRRREEEIRRMIEEQEVEQKRVRDARGAVRQGYDEAIREIKKNQVSREAEMRKEVESIAAAARAGSVCQYCGSFSNRRNRHVWNTRRR